LAGARTERYPEGARHDDREGKRPEHRFRLAEKFAKARQRELDAAARKAERAAEKARQEADEAAAAVERAERDLAEAKG
jgi:hypothetical protein